jgi:DNA-nicking Smr family endonuclease
VSEEEELFQRVMAEMGVGGKRGSGRDRSPRAEPRRRRREPPEQELDDRELFLDSVRNLEMVPPKDDVDDSPQPSKQLKKRLPKKKRIDCADVLDLHGLTRNEALTRLADFVTKAFLGNLKSVMVITGKGKHSRAGAPVIKPAVEQWVRTKGRRFITAYAEAPRAYGGRGALLLELKSR